MKRTTITKKFLAGLLILTMVLTGSVAALAAEQPAADLNTPQAAGTELLNLETEWKYLDDNTDPAEGGERTSWTVNDFDDSGWKSSAGHLAKFGAKNGKITDLGNNSIPDVLLAQYIGNTSNDIPAYFFRTNFSLDCKPEGMELTGTLKYDDAAIIYVNGVQVAAFDVPEGGFASNLSYGGSNAGSPIDASFHVDASVLREGSNTVAVELHQGRASSSDIYFELSELTLAEKKPFVAAQDSIFLSVGADETQMNFTWYSNEPESGLIYLAKQSELVDEEMPEDAKTISAEAVASNRAGYYSYQATATELDRNTTYAYQLVNGDTKGEIMTFTTGKSGAFSFAFVGDPQIGASGDNTGDSSGWDKTLGIIGENSIFADTDFLLSAGDQVNTADNEKQYTAFLEHEPLQSLPTATVVGNHDSNSGAYDQHFNVPNQSSYGATSASSDYYFVYNDVLFLVINSNNRSAAEHKAFMEAAIEETANQPISWKVVTFHHSIYSVASHAEDSDILARRTELVPIFEELDIDVVLMGHDHVYCRSYMMDGLEPITDASYYDDENYTSITNPEGILYVTANSASGSKFYGIQTSLNFPYARVMNQERVPNVSKVDVSNEHFTVTTYRTSDLSVVDTFTINRTHVHKAVHVSAVPATYTKEGKREHWYCEDCGKYYSDAACTQEIGDFSTLIIPKLTYVIPDLPTTDNPGVSDPGADNPGIDNPADENPDINVPDDDVPGSEKPDISDPGSVIPDGKTPTVSSPDTLDKTSSDDGQSAIAPQTGDNFHLTIWLGILVFAALICIAVVIIKERRKLQK